MARRYQQDGRDEVKVFVPFADLNVRDANGFAGEGTGVLRTDPQVSQQVADSRDRLR